MAAPRDPGLQSWNARLYNFAAIPVVVDNVGKTRSSCAATPACIA